MSAQASDVVIERFYLQGDTRKRQQILESFDQQRWYGQDSEQVFVIRRLELRGPWWKIGHQAAEQARVIAREALPADHQNAHSAHAVVFLSQAHFCANFCRDIARNTSKAWYWQNRQELTMNTQQAIASLLSDNIFYLPRVVALLEGQQALDEVFAPLELRELEQLLETISAFTGWSAVTAKVQMLDMQNVTNRDLDNTHLPLASCLNSIEAWAAVIHKATAKKKLLLLRFLSVVLAWRYAPQILQSKALLSLWQQQITNLAFKTDDVTTQPYSKERMSTNSSAATLGADETFPSEEHPSGESAFLPQAKEASGLASLNKNLQDEVTPTSAKPLFCGEAFQSRNAGIFYLLNVLQQIRYFSQNERREFSTWYIVYRLSHRLQVSLDAPMLHFLSQQNNLRNAGELEGLSGFDKEEETLLAAQKRFGQHEFWPRALVSTPGQVCFTESHLDVYFHMKYLRLDIRLAGLDVNPGWLPSIGRVVNFHYGQDPQTDIGATQ